MSKNSPGVIVFEGPPLMGKTTQAGMLEDYLQDEGCDVKVLKRAEEYCPSRAEINTLREEADGWTRELDRITPEYETELWADYYREKTESIEKVIEEENPDFIIFDRYFLSLIPTQEPALDATVEELVEKYRQDIEALNSDVNFLMTSETDIFPERYQKREGQQIPKDFHQDMNTVKKNYQKLAQIFNFTEIEASNPEQEVFDEIKQEIENKNLI